MISSNAFRFLAVAGGLTLGALAAAAEAAVFQASATTDLRDVQSGGGGGESFFSFFLPQYSGPGTIVGVNIRLSGSISGLDAWFYEVNLGITVEDYSRTWQIALLGPPNPSGGSFLEVDVPAEYVGGSVPPCAPPFCGGYNDFPVSSGPAAFSAGVDVSDFSDFVGSGSNAFVLAVSRGAGDMRIDYSELFGSATLTETILAAVPEAPTWVMVLIGFAIVGFAAHSRRLARASRRAV